MRNKLMWIIWAGFSVALVSLFIYIFMYGNTSDTTGLSKELGGIWGAMTAFMIGPALKAMRQWSESRRKLVLSSAIGVVVVIALLFLLRGRQTVKLQDLFREDREVESDAAPKKQRFMQVLSEKQNAKTLPEYLQRCAELGTAINDYEPVERQVDTLLSQMQQEISELKPQGSYGSLLPGFAVLRAVVAKDIEGAEAQRKEVGYAEQLPDIPEASRAQFYTSNIQPVAEQESKIAQAEIEILKDAKRRGITLPESVYQGAGIE
jgi:hypothetical protein